MSEPPSGRHDARRRDENRTRRYPHDEPQAYAAGENYFPEALQGARYYHPTANGLEGRITEKLARLRDWDRHSEWRRYRE